MSAEPSDRQRVLAYLAERADRPLTPRDLAKGLRIPQEEYRRFRGLLRDMEQKGEVFR